MLNSDVLTVVMCNWPIDIIPLCRFGGLILPLRGMFTVVSHIPNVYLNIEVTSSVSQCRVKKIGTSEGPTSCQQKCIPSLDSNYLTVVTKICQS
jgi:hypothetical protein